MNFEEDDLQVLLDVLDDWLEDPETDDITPRMTAAIRLRDAIVEHLAKNDDEGD